MIFDIGKTFSDLVSTRSGLFFQTPASCFFIRIKKTFHQHGSMTNSRNAPQHFPAFVTAAKTSEIIVFPETDRNVPHRNLWKRKSRKKR
jgi:hypothetical protein